ncbi:MAG: hypothetical protein CMJ54_10770 [Planctomycetaceae bacterium]|nr:hypothetical protein [Planctomycetaceae bacterium]
MAPPANASITSMLVMIAKPRTRRLPAPINSVTASPPARKPRLRSRNRSGPTTEVASGAVSSAVEVIVVAPAASHGSRSSGAMPHATTSRMSTVAEVVRQRNRDRSMVRSPSSRPIDPDGRRAL